jgi:hypothetical protein
VSSAYYDRVLKAIAHYSQLVEETVKDLRNPCMLDIVFIVVVPIVGSIIAYFFASTAGLLAVLGLGGINAAEKFSRGQTILKSYFSGRSKLRKSVRTLELTIKLCDPYDPDPTCVQKVENQLKEYISALP